MTNKSGPSIDPCGRPPYYIAFDCQKIYDDNGACYQLNINCNMKRRASTLIVYLRRFGHHYQANYLKIIKKI